MHLTRPCAAALIAALILPATARADEKAKGAPYGKVERLDPRFDELVPKDAQMEKLADGFDWSEGPVWDRKAGRVLFSDIPKNTVWEWSEKGGLKEHLKPSGYSGKDKFTGREPGSNGLLFDKEGRFVLCQHGDRRVARREADGTFTTLADKYMGKRLNSPNDAVFHSNGTLYFTDPPYGLPKGVNDPGRELDFQGVYKLSPKGELTLLTKEMSRPNGIALSPDEKTLYVANSDGARPVWMAFPVQADGTVGEGKVFADARKFLPKGRIGGGDGMKVDAKGNVWATGPGGVLVFAPDGTHLGSLLTGVPTANCGWGDDGSTLYITANKDLARIRTNAKGLGF